MDIFGRAQPGDAPCAGKSSPQPFSLDLRGDRLELRVGGTPVDLRLVQRVTIDINAEDMVQRVKLEFIATDLNIELPAVQIGAALVPLTKASADFTSRIVPAANRRLDVYPLRVGDEAFECTRVGIMDACRAFFKLHGREPRELRLTVAIERDIARLVAGGETTEPVGPTLMGLTVIHGAETCELR